VERIGDYTITRVLGQGGMGVVYEATHPRLGHSVALKLLQPGANESRRARFRREATALSRLDHPNLIGLIDFGEDPGGRPWIAMRLVEGEDLQEALRYGPLPVPEVTRIGAELCKALSAVHEAGLLHRDLKPENVLRGADGTITLTDFGLTKDLEIEASVALSQTGALQGTPGYWAPEQASGKGKQATPATDVYGLGATLYALLTGRPPAEGGSVLEIMVATRELAPARPSELGIDVPEWLEDLVLRALAKDPSERFESAAAMLATLERQSQAPESASRAGLIVLGLGGALALALLAGGALVLDRLEGDPPPPATASPTPEPSAEEIPPDSSDHSFTYRGLLPMGVLLDEGRRALMGPLPGSYGGVSAQSEALVLRDPATGAVLRTWDGGARFVCASRQGRTAAFSQRQRPPGSVSAREVVVWISGATGKVRRTLPVEGTPTTAAFASETDLVLATQLLGDSYLESLDLESGESQEIASFPKLDGHIVSVSAHRGWTAALLRSRKRFSEGFLWTRVLAWNPVGEKVLDLKGTRASEVVIREVPGGARLAFAQTAGPPQVIALPRGSVTRLTPDSGLPGAPDLRPRAARQVEFASSDRLLYAATDGRLLSWDLTLPAAPPQVLRRTGRTGACLSLLDGKVLHLTLISELADFEFKVGQVYAEVSRLSSLEPPR
jgi:serine/threonine protein kinase